MNEQSLSRRWSSTSPLVVALALLIGAAACKSEPAAPVPEPAPVAVAEPEPAEPEDPLAEARADAEERARALVMPLNDQAQFIAADLEATGQQAAPAAAAPRRAARIAEPETGRLVNQSRVRAILAENQGAMQRCYERALRRNPDLRGRVMLNLLVASSGKVSEARAQGQTLKDPMVNECMEIHARTMTFPQPEGGAVRLDVPYTFNPQL